MKTALGGCVPDRQAVDHGLQSGMPKIPNWPPVVIVCFWSITAALLFSSPIFQSGWFLQVIGGISYTAASWAYFAAIGEYESLVNKTRAIYEDRIYDLASAKESLELDLESMRIKLIEHEQGLANAKLRQFTASLDEALSPPDRRK